MDSSLREQNGQHRDVPRGFGGLEGPLPGRFQLFHFLSREGSDLPLLSGRIDDAKIRVVHDRLLGGREVDGWYLCGPYDMVMAVRRTLGELGAEEARIHDELFFAGPLDPDSAGASAREGSVDTVILDGRAVETRMTPETSILDAALRVRSELPFSCKGGMCATCKGRIEGARCEWTRTTPWSTPSSRPATCSPVNRIRSRISRRPLRPPLMVVTRNSRPTWWPLPEAVRRAWLSRHIHARPGTRTGAARFVALRPCRVEAGPSWSRWWRRGRLFQDSAEEALAQGGTAAEAASARCRPCRRARQLDVVRTFLNEARMLDEVHRARVIDARDAYEAAFRAVAADGVEDGSFGAGTDPKMASIFILSILNAVERWYRSDGALDRAGLVDAIHRSHAGIVGGSGSLRLTRPGGWTTSPSASCSGRKSDSAPVGRRVFTVHVPWLVMSGRGRPRRSSPWRPRSGRASEPRRWERLTSRKMPSGRPMRPVGELLRAKAIAGRTGSGHGPGLPSGRRSTSRRWSPGLLSSPPPWRRRRTRSAPPSIRLWTRSSLPVSWMKALSLKTLQF